ncbi:MAG: SpoIIE family protein phosphatase [Acidobacteriota bacterium]|nr:SpoIIE family protein phosphatase [Acidobacteriota bacterium]
MRRAGLIVLLLLCSAASRAHGQTPAPAAVKDSAGSIDLSGPLQVTLGDSSKKLNGPWKFHTGDDPSWMQASFDDSSWESMDLAPRPGAMRVGWTKRGHPGYSGFAWYRLRVAIKGATHPLAIQMPDGSDDAYQVFVNGQLIGDFGKFSGSRVKAYPGLPLAFPLPKNIKDGTITIAIRMWMDSATIFNSPDSGGLHGPPTLGYNSLISNLISLEYDIIAHYFSGGILEVMILFMALLMTISLFWLDREEKAYLWLAIVCTATLLENGIVLSVNFTAWIGQTAAVVLSQVIFAQARIGLWVLFWGYWFRLARINKLHQVVWALTSLLIIGTAMLRAPLYGQVVPVQYAAFITPALSVVKIALGVLLFLVAYRGFKTQKTEGWMAGAAVLLGFIANYQREMYQIHVPITFTILGFTISLGAAATITALLIITVMLLRRFIMAQRLKEQWKMEIQQAQEVQQLLIPAALPEVSGITIESEYRPAREVGGDFFQILPLETPGAVLIVVGDVTGKGMQAGMLVALIVGAIRGALMHSSDPARILYEVNEQLCERQHAIATCLILRIDPDGTGIIANAGQLAPYLNGTEIEMEGAFPIGIVPDGEFAVSSFALKEGDNLFLMSDGVVEATDPQGALFGFERIAELLDRHATSQEIAAAAQQFGQEDDILVLQVRRNIEQPVELHA